MSVEPTAPTPMDQASSDPAPLDPTSHVTAAPITAAPITAAPVTVSEVAEFLRHLTELRTSGRGDDPAARAAFLHRKAELFTRLATDPALSAAPPAPGRGTP
jgi:hypothetical protein